jgi:hypothetical protein
MMDQRAEFFTAVMGLAATAGWRRLNLAEIAEAAGLTLADLQRDHGGKSRILGAFADYIDEQVMLEQSEDGTPRDRLFDVLMRRFDALSPYKEGLAVILREGGGGGVCAAICGGQRLLRSMAWSLEAAGIGSAGLVGAVRTKGLALVYAGAFLTWLRDDTEDMSRTMATLDRNLAQAERLANGLPAWRRRRDPASDGEANPDMPPPGPDMAPPGPGGAPVTP